MGYPTSVFNPAARSNGQTIDAAIINDLQTEQTAVETGLLGTITHSLNVSGASTLATLQAGASTVASLEVTAGSSVHSLQVSSGSTFGLRPIMPPPQAAVVFLEAVSDIGSSADSTLSFVAQSVLTNSSMHSTTTDPSRLIPQTTGLYQISAQITVTRASAASLRQLVIQDSSGSGIANVIRPPSTHTVRMQAHGYKRFDALGGYVVCRYVTDGASTSSFSSGVAETWFALHKL